MFENINVYNINIRQCKIPGIIYRIGNKADENNIINIGFDFTHFMKFMTHCISLGIVNHYKGISYQLTKLGKEKYIEILEEIEKEKEENREKKIKIFNYRTRWIPLAISLLTFILATYNSCESEKEVNDLKSRIEILENVK